MIKLDVSGKQITILVNENKDYISLTDIAKFRNNDAPADVVKNWMRSKSTIDFLGLWEKLNNPKFKLFEFDQFKNQAGNNYFVWRESNSSKDGNIRDYAQIEQLVVLSNLESINSVLIHQGLSQADRIRQLNHIAITQMKSLVGNKELKRLK